MVVHIFLSHSLEALFGAHLGKNISSILSALFFVG